MGFEVNCLACGARFNLSGELYERKVKGRVVTIKCKKCSAPISVDATDSKSGPRQELPDPDSWEATETPRRSAPANLTDATEMSPTLPMPGTVSEMMWLVSYGDQDDREMTLLQVRQALRAGEIEAKTLVWREGMKEWLALEKVPPLAKLVSKQAADKAPAPEKKVTTLLGIAPRANAPSGEAAPISVPPSEPPLSVEPGPPSSEEPTPLSEAPTPQPVPPVAPRPPPARAPAPVRAEPAPVRAAPAPVRTAPAPVRAEPVPVKEPPRRGPRALSPGLLGFGPVQPPTVSLGPQPLAPKPAPPATSDALETPKPVPPPRLSGVDPSASPKPVPATSTPLPTGAKPLPKAPAARTLPAAMLAAQRAATAGAKPAAPAAKPEAKPKPTGREPPKPPRAKAPAPAASAAEASWDDHAQRFEAAAAAFDKGGVAEAPADPAPAMAPSAVGVAATVPLASAEAETAAPSPTPAPADVTPTTPEQPRVAEAAAVEPATSSTYQDPAAAADMWDDRPPVPAEFSAPMAKAALAPPTAEPAHEALAAPKPTERSDLAPPKGSRGRLALGLVAAALAAFGGTWLVLRPPSETRASASAAVEPPPEKAPAPVAPAPPTPPPAETASAAPPGVEPSEPEPAPAPAPEARNAATKAPPTTQPASEAPAPRAERPAAAPAAETPKPPETARPVAVKAAAEPPKAGEAKSGDAPFDKAAALSALTSAAGAASSCRKEGDPSGMATVVITFAPSGRVTSANINGPPFAGTPTGGCIASTMRRAKVPPFSGSHITVSRTVVIQ